MSTLYQLHIALLTRNFFKDVIKPLIMARFDKFMAEQSTQTQANGHTTVATASPEATPSHTSPTPRSASKGPSVEAEESSEVVDTHTKKKRKRSPLDEDAVFAARLQAEENSRARPTRGGGVTKKVVPAKKKKTPKKKTADRVDAADDSELDSESAEKKVNRSGGFHVSLNLAAQKNRRGNQSIGNIKRD